MSPQPSISVDWSGIENDLIGGAIAGLQGAVNFTAVRAKKYAPVRAIFNRNRRGASFTGNFGAIGEHIRGGRTSPGGSGYQAWKRSRAQNRRIDVPQNAFAQAGPRYGHNNSFIPVMRYMDLHGNTVVSGDMRRYSPSAKTLSPHIQAFKKVGREGVRETEVNPNDFLSYRGRQEARSGRAGYRDVTRSRLETGPNGKITRVPTKTSDFLRLGGRLRGEIFPTPPQRQGNFYWAFVISPVEYSAPQEYGTRHNRPHPFLRPALYEARTKLRDSVARGVRNTGDKARKGSGARIGGVTGRESGLGTGNF